MGPKVDPTIEDWVSSWGLALAQPTNSQPRILVVSRFDAFQGEHLEGVEMRVGLTDDVERHLLIEGEEFVCVLEK